MGSREVDQSARPVTGPALRAAREVQRVGLSRRQLLRRAVGAGVGLWFVEMTAGTLGFLWSATVRAGGRVRIGTYREFLTASGVMLLPTPAAWVVAGALWTGLGLWQAVDARSGDGPRAILG